MRDRRLRRRRRYVWLSLSLFHPLSPSLYLAPLTSLLLPPSPYLAPPFPSLPPLRFTPLESERSADRGTRNARRKRRPRRRGSWGWRSPRKGEGPGLIRWRRCRLRRGGAGICSKALRPGVGIRLELGLLRSTWGGLGCTDIEGWTFEAWALGWIRVDFDD